MISASKYQHIIYFMSLLKVSFCIYKPKQRLLFMDTRRGCRSKRSPTPWKNQNIFFRCMEGHFATFFHGEGFMLRFYSYEVFISSYGSLFATFLLRGGGGAFLLHLPFGVGRFSQCRGLFCYFFLHVREPFLSSWGILCLYGFFSWACPFPL